MREEAIKLNDKGVELAKANRLGPALNYFIQASKTDPSFEIAVYNAAVTYNNIAKGFMEKGDLYLAKNLLLKCISTHNLFYPAFSNLTDVVMQLTQWKEKTLYETKLQELEEMVLGLNQKSPQTPFLSVLRNDDPIKNLANAKSWVQSIKDKANNYHYSKMKRVNKNMNNQKSTIRVGYVSDGFRDFPTGHNLLDVVRHHNKEKFEINLYNHGDNDGSFYRKEFEKLADSFIDMNNWNLKEAVDKITQDQVDILVDLKGHTQGGNLEIFVTHPAKVTISWLGFPGTTGMDFIDYAIVDRVVVPKGEEQYWTEKLIFMPNSYRPVDTGTTPSKKKITRKDFGLPESEIVFSSFNNAYKIEPVMWEVWMNILKRVPNSVLWLWERFPEASSNLRAHAKEYGVDPKRLVFTGRLPKDEHLARIRLADIALDTRIVNGHTTTAETIRMGVPVIALFGNHFCSRVSSSILKACKMDELITHSLTDYEDLAVNLATNPKKLNKLMTKLAKHLKITPLLDTALFTKNLEKAYLATIDRYTKNLMPKQFNVK